MITSDEYIRFAIEESWEYLEESAYPDDLLTEWADSQVPVYTREIIQEWVDLPNDYKDEGWQQYTDNTDNMTITTLMSYDLYYYYQDRYSAIYRQILDERGEVI